MMTKEDIIRMAEEAGDGWDQSLLEDVAIITLERFAALIASAEREACAKVADEHWVFGMSSAYIADAIRARGEK